VSDPEPDVRHQAAADALLAIIAKPDEFRGESRSIAWAHKFVIFEVSTQAGRHFWRNPSVSLDAEEWHRLPARFGVRPGPRGRVARSS
jgi:RNA polymerase sigma-70 factor (ECF subfamily)